jgi:hypothetical protein
MARWGRRRGAGRAEDGGGVVVLQRTKDGMEWPQDKTQRRDMTVATHSAAQARPTRPR